MVTTSLLAHWPAAPNSYALTRGLFGTRIDFNLGQGAERMINNRRSEARHTERIALHLRLVQELGSDDHRRRATQRFESDSVMRTARRARPSVADRR